MLTRTPQGAVCLATEQFESVWQVVRLHVGSPCGMSMRPYMIQQLPMPRHVVAPWPMVSCSVEMTGSGHWQPLVG
jgi:hypothetical protein